LNFDTESGTQQVSGTKELLSGVQWRISQQICAFLCSLSEKCGEFIAEQIRESQSMSAMTSPKVGMEVDEFLDGVSGMTLAWESAQQTHLWALFLHNWMVCRTDQAKRVAWCLFTKRTTRLRSFILD
jgi:hypothetical protein